MAKSVYIAGPMRGIPLYNFPAFDRAKARLEADGWEVESPADYDRKEGYHPEDYPAGFDWSKLPDGLELYKVAERDLCSVRHCDAIYLLSGWQNSAGARAEFAVAKWLGKEIIGASPGEGTEVLRVGEVRITDPETGGQKGVKLERFDLIPAEPLEDLARVYGYGATKYDDDNWRKGYKWRLSFGAMMRHAWAFWRGEDTDEESGLPHLAHVAWHCMTLLWFSKYRKEKDDRQEAA